MSEDKFKSFCERLHRKYIVESFYSVWKPQAKKSIWILDIGPDDRNFVLLNAISLAISIYGNEIIPFTINVATAEMADGSEDLSDEALGLPPISAELDKSL
jgi:hypothetical protein